MKNYFLNRISTIFRLLFNGDIRGAFRYKLWLIGYQNTLPSFLVRSVDIIECNEPLVKIPESKKLVVVAPEPFFRKSLSAKLLQVASSLPKNISLKVLYAYRSPEVQKQFWDEVVNDVLKQNPGKTDEEGFSLARKLSAEPGGIGPHQTGGAVDVTLVDENGNELVMGTTYRDHTLVNKIPMFSKQCSVNEKANRKLLRKAMLGAGFYFYPGEWWHYSYGDQSWALYTGHKNAIYGEVLL